MADSTTPNVAIVGAAGYVGSALHKHLRERGYANVRGFHRNPRAVKFEQVIRTFHHHRVNKYIAMHDTEAFKLSSDSLLCGWNMEEQSKASGYTMEEIQKGACDCSNLRSMNFWKPTHPHGASTATIPTTTD